MEILIIHPGGLGDLVLSLPAVTVLRKKFPHARITVAGNADHLVPVMSGYAHKIHSISKLPLYRIYANDLSSEQDLGFWRSFDLIISWTGWQDQEFISRFKSIHPNVCIASWKPVPGETRHVSRIFVDSLSLAGIVDTEVEFPHVHLSPELRSQGRAWLIAQGWNGHDSLTAIHPGAGSKTKRWSLSRFKSLAYILSLDDKKRILIVEGSAERGLAEKIIPEIPGDRAIVFDRMSLDLLAAVLSNCEPFIGNDSGIAHLAASLGVRCIVLFGPTLPQNWAPLGRDVTILRNTQGCEGCSSDSNSHTCLENITVEEVVQSLR